MLSLSARRRARKERSFRPAMFGLEPRYLLDAGVVKSLTGPSVVGQHFQLQAVQSNGLPYPTGAISSITWTISGAVTSRTLSPDGGFQDKPITNVTTHGDTIEGYWTDAPGSHSITETVSYVQPTWQGLPIPVQWPTTITASYNVQPITASVNFYVTRPTDSFRDPESISGFSLGSSVRYDVNVNSQVPATVGVIQTVHSTIIERYVDGWEIRGADPDTFRPYEFLDNSPEVPGGGNSPYYATFSSVTGKPPALTVDAGQVLHLADFPTTYLDNDAEGVSRYDEFSDHVIVTPHGGIPVDVGSFGWKWGGTAIWDSNELPYTIAKTNPYLTTSSYPGGIKPFGSLPKWDMTADEEPPGAFYQWMPSNASFLALLPAGWVNQLSQATAVPTTTHRFDDGANTDSYIP